ncbi:MAG: hypothetical protein E7521_09135 [Ruminococcaceae bacterium]|nr:hypothetical protein [Oscillospiraceae bacterium]
MESLISLDGFADVANNLIDRLSNAVGWVATHKTPTKIAIDTYIEDIQNSNYDPVTKAALISKAKKTVKEYCNQYDIVNKALEMITPTAEPEKIDSDWLAQFMDKTRPEAYFPVGKAVYTRIGDALCGAVHPEKVDDFFEKICVPAWDKYKEKSEKDSFLI